MKKISLALTGILTALTPVFAFAVTDVESILTGVFQPILNAIIPLLITAGVIFFIWGVVQYVIADDEKAKEAGKNRIMWGLIGLFVIVTFWGLIRVIQNTLNIDQDANIIDDIAEVNPFEN